MEHILKKMELIPVVWQYYYRNLNKQWNIKKKEIFKKNWGFNLLFNIDYYIIICFFSFIINL